MWDRTTVVEVVAGRHGYWGIRGGASGRVPIGALIQLRNATLEDYTWRTGPGASTFGTAIGSAVKAGFDYDPDPVTQRTLVACADGTLRKDDGLGLAWTTLASGLQMAAAVPQWSAAGSEAAARSRKAFYCDGFNAPRVLSADGITASVIANPNQDWTGTNQPAWMATHRFRNWAGGVLSNPHFVYDSLDTDHEDFRAGDGVDTVRIPLGPLPKQQKSVGAMDYKGGLLVFCYPVGVYWINTTSADDGDWFATKVADVGCAGPRCFTAFEDDVLYIDPFGGWHTISATDVTGSLRATDITARKLGRFGRQMSLPQLVHADLVYDSERSKVMLAYAPAGQITKSARLDLDLTAKGEVGENWVTWDRDVNESLFLLNHAANEADAPVISDENGQLWLLERENRSKVAADGTRSGYRFEWWMQDTDFAPVLPSWAGRKKNLHFLQIETDMRGTAAHTIEVWRDGRKRQTIEMTLVAGSGIVFGDAATDTFDEGEFGPDTPQTSQYKRLFGQANRLALRGYSEVADADVSITKLRIGMTRAG